MCGPNCAGVFPTNAQSRLTKICLCSPATNQQNHYIDFLKLLLSLSFGRCHFMTCGRCLFAAVGVAVVIFHLDGVCGADLM